MTRPSLASASRSTQFFAWVGFNASLCLGALLFATIYLSLAIRHIGLLGASSTLVWLLVVGAASYVLLAQRHWIRIPLVGIAISGGCFLGAALTR